MFVKCQRSCYWQAFPASLIFAGKVIAYLSVELFRYGYAPRASNSRIGWNGLPGTTTLADCEHEQVADLKCCITFGTEVNAIFIRGDKVS